MPPFLNNLKDQIRWFHATRGIGIVTVLYGMFIDKTGDRGTILLGGFGLLGLDKVARSDKDK